jgi:hypothetical protein
MKAWLAEWRASRTSGLVGQYIVGDQQPHDRQP